MSADVFSFCSPLESVAADPPTRAAGGSLCVPANRQSLLLQPLQWNNFS